MIDFIRSLPKRAVILQILQSITYIPFTAGIGILIDDILRNELLNQEQRYLYIGIYALANLLLWPIHGWFTVRAFARSQEVVRAVTARLRRMLVDKLQSMSLSFFTRRGAGALSNQVSAASANVSPNSICVCNNPAKIFLSVLSSSSAACERQKAWATRNWWPDK